MNFHYMLLFKKRSMPSAAEMALDLISYARWVSIMLTISSTTLTLDASSMP